MSKPKKIPSSVSGIQSEVDRLVSEGHDKTFIANYISNAEEFLTIQHKSQVVLDMITAHPNYETIQLLKRSKIAFDISAKSDKSTFYYFDPITRKKSSANINVVEMFTNTKIFNLRKNAHICELRYDPFTSKIIYKDKNGGNVYNTYIPPVWMENNFYSNKPIPEANLPSEYNLFFNHLVGGHVESYEYLLDWMANAIKSRNYCFLVTIGYQGIGKGVLGGILMSLFGLQNSALTALKRTTGQFNSQIGEKRFIQIDEFSMKTRAEEEAVKGLVNDIVEVEKKNVDAKNETNYANFYFTSNSWDALKLDADDRRFSIIELTDQRLDTLIKDKNEINRIQKDEKLIAQLGQYLYNRPIDETKMLKVFRSKRFEELKSISMAVWQEWLINTFAIKNASKTVPISKILSTMREILGTKTNITMATVKEFAQQYPESMIVSRPFIDNTDKRQWVIKFKDVNTNKTKIMEN